MQINFVVVREGYGNATLRIFRVGFVEAFFGEDRDAPVFGEFNCGTKSCDAGFL